MLEQEQNLSLADIRPEDNRRMHNHLVALSVWIALESSFFDLRPLVVRSLAYLAVKHKDLWDFAEMMILIYITSSQKYPV